MLFYKSLAFQYKDLGRSYNLIAKQRNYYLITFFLAFAMAFIFMLPSIIYDQGYFIYFGDFNMQQIPFYKNAQDSILNGEWGWNWYTDLGVNFIGSYTFYLLGSPFFYISLLFPNSFLPYIMGPLLMLKFGLMALFSYIWLKRHIKTPLYAVLAAILYSFSGYSIFNMVFNHFHDVMVFFPLLLIGLDDLMEKNKKGLFAFAVFINCCVNYFFFVGEVVFIVLYFIIRMMDKKWTLNIKKTLSIAVESILGVAMSAALLIPTMITLMENSRVNEKLLGWDLLVYENPKLPLFILQSFFFPPENAARITFFPELGKNWASVSGWLPLFGATGIIAWIISRKNSWIKRIIIACVVMSIIPGLNHMFVMFNQSFYTRWFYMLSLMSALATAKSLEEDDIDWRRAIKYTAIVIGITSLAIGFLPGKDAEGNIYFGLYERKEGGAIFFWCFVAAAALLLYITIRVIQGKRRTGQGRTYPKRTLISTIIVTVIVCFIYLIIGKFHSYDSRNYIVDRIIEGEENIDLPDDENYRIDGIEAFHNISMFWKQPALSSFHSIVPVATSEFYDAIGLHRGVASTPDATHGALRDLLSVRFVYTDDEESEISLRSLGYQIYDKQNDFNVLENPNFIPMGFSYDKYILRSEFDKLDNKTKESVMLAAMVIDDEDESKIKSSLQKITPVAGVGNTFGAISDNCAARKAMACDSFAMGKNSFSASIDCPENTYVFFSVPHDSGWSASVNNKPIEIVTGNVGFMAVACEKGANEIEFTYETPGLKAGVYVSAAAFIALMAYLILSYVSARRRPSSTAVEEILDT